MSKPTSGTTWIVVIGVSLVALAWVKESITDVQYDRAVAKDKVLNPGNFNGNTNPKAQAVKPQKEKPSNPKKDGGLNTVAEFERSRFYKGMGMQTVESQSANVHSYHSPATGAIFGLRTSGGRITEARMAYSENKLPSDPGDLLTQFTMFIGELAGVTQAKQEMEKLGEKVGARLTDKSTSAFRLNNWNVQIDIIDVKRNQYANSYVGVILSR